MQSELDEPSMRLAAFYRLADGAAWAASPAEQRRYLEQQTGHGLNVRRPWLDGHKLSIKWGPGSFTSKVVETASITGFGRDVYELVLYRDFRMLMNAWFRVWLGPGPLAAGYVLLRMMEIEREWARQGYPPLSDGKRLTPADRYDSLHVWLLKAALNEAGEVDPFKRATLCLRWTCVASERAELEAAIPGLSQDERSG